MAARRRGSGSPIYHGPMETEVIGAIVANETESLQLLKLAIARADCGRAQRPRNGCDVSTRCSPARRPQHGSKRCGGNDRSSRHASAGCHPVPRRLLQPSRRTRPPTAPPRPRPASLTGGSNAGSTAPPPSSRSARWSGLSGPDGRILILRKPDGGFWRLRPTNDSRGSVAADGAEQANVVAIASRPFRGRDRRRSLPVARECDGPPSF